MKINGEVEIGMFECVVCSMQCRESTSKLRKRREESRSLGEEGHLCGNLASAVQVVWASELE